MVVPPYLNRITHNGSMKDKLLGGSAGTFATRHGFFKINVYGNISLTLISTCRLHWTLWIFYRMHISYSKAIPKRVLIFLFSQMLNAAKVSSLTERSSIYNIQKKKYSIRHLCLNLTGRYTNLILRAATGLLFNKSVHSTFIWYWPKSLFNGT